MDIIINTIDVKPDFGGIVINWENTTGKEASVSVTYKDPDDPNKKIRKTFDASKSGKGGVAGLPVEATDFSISVIDGFYNESDAVTFNATPLLEVEFDKTEWSIPGYNADSNEGTIGYSSQGREAFPKGYIVAIFDGIYDTSNTASFWSSSWSPQKQYPHWYIVDLGKESIISRVALMGRMRTANTADNRAQKGHQILTCTSAGATDPGNSEVWQWEDQGIYNFDPTKTDIQSSRLLNNPTARYIKVYFPVDKKGTGNDAMIGEMWVYGSH